MTNYLRSQFEYLKTALEKLSAALAADKTTLIYDATCHRFELGFDLAVKLLKSANLELGKECNSPNDCIRIAAQTALLDNPKEWIGYLKLRNLATHTYKEEIAKEVYGQIGSFLKDAKTMLETIRQKFLPS